MGDIFEGDFETEYTNKIDQISELFDSTKKCVKNCKFPKNAESKFVLTYDEIKEKLALENGKRYIYIIFWTSKTETAETISEKFNKEKNKEKKEFSLPLNNYNDAEKDDFNQNKVLYVGSSKDITTRLQQHFSITYKTTYALHLPAWADEIECKVYAVCMEHYLNNENDNDRDYELQIIEDIIASIYKPLLGKRGPNTK
ncbi:MAG: GIY-YIG nuclease family protein [Treponema sp.]|nr:GIY-YIG nuclease family protein [Treponema sp.]